MKRRSALLGAAMMVVLGGVVPFGTLRAQEASAPGLQISGGFIRAMPMTGGTAAAFMTIRSTGSADRLVGFRTPACTRPELHTHIMDNGIMRMREVPVIEVPAGGEAVLQSGGLHLMLIDLTGPLAQGDLVPLTLIFETAGAVDVTLPVKPPGAMN